MKNKMELTIGICVGSSIVRSFRCCRCIRADGQRSAANCRLCCAAARYCGLDHAPRPHAVLRRLRGAFCLLPPADFVGADVYVQTIVLFVSVLLVNFLIQYVSCHCCAHALLLTLFCRDGKSNYMEGLMLVTLYLVIALACESPRRIPRNIRSLAPHSLGLITHHASCSSVPDSRDTSPPSAPSLVNMRLHTYRISLLSAGALPNRVAPFVGRCFVPTCFMFMYRTFLLELQRVAACRHLEQSLSGLVAPA